MFPFMSQNLHATAIRKYLFEILRDRYMKNEKFIDKLATTITTNEDYESLGSLVVDIFELGFLKAVGEYKDQLAKMGLRVNIVPEEKPNKDAKKIFGQSEKSG